MGNFCVGDKQELNVCENTFISEITFNGCKIYVIHGNILQNQMRGILNASIDPNSYNLMKLQDMNHEYLKLNIPIIQRLPPGLCQQEFIINLKVNYKDNRRELIEAYEQALDLINQHELETVGYREGMDKFKDKQDFLNNAECLMEAILNKINNNQMIKQFTIFSVDKQLCLQYKNELKRIQHKLINKNQFQRCNTQDQLNESTLEYHKVYSLDEQTNITDINLIQNAKPQKNIS